LQLVFLANDGVGPTAHFRRSTKYSVMGMQADPVYGCFSRKPIAATAFLLSQAQTRCTSLLGIWWSGTECNPSPP